MRWIPGGTFLMGSDNHYPEEAPAHTVRVDGFWMAGGSMSPVDAYPATGYGLHDMAGNVWQWTPLFSAPQMMQRALTKSR